MTTVAAAALAASTVLVASPPPHRRGRGQLARDRVDHADHRGDEGHPVPPHPQGAALNGRRVTTLFYEASTRTRVSFETAARNLSADVVSIATATSSVTKASPSSIRSGPSKALGAEILVIAPLRLRGALSSGRDLRRARPQRWRRLACPSHAGIAGPLHDAGARFRAAICAAARSPSWATSSTSRVARSNIWTLNGGRRGSCGCADRPLSCGDGSLGGALVRRRRFPRPRPASTCERHRRCHSRRDVVQGLRIQRERMQGGLLAVGFASTRPCSS